MKNLGQYNEDLSVPRKEDIDSLETRVKTNEDNIAMAESDIESLNTDVDTLKTDVSGVKTALSSKQDTITGAASTIVDDNLAAGKVLVSNNSGKVSAARGLGYNSDALFVGDYARYGPSGSYIDIVFNNKYAIGAAVDSSTETELDGVAIGSLVSADRYIWLKSDQVTFGNDDTPIKVTGVADATNDHDAVNLGQLNDALGNYISKTNTGTQSMAGPLNVASVVTAIGQTQHLSLQVGGRAPVIGVESTLGEINVFFDTGESTIQLMGSSILGNPITLAGIKDGVNDADAVNVSQLNEVKNSIPEVSKFLPVTGGTLLGNLNLNTNELYLDGNGYRISTSAGRLQIRQATDLTPNSVAITEYNDDANKQLHIVVNDSSDGSHNTQLVLKKNTLQLYNNTVSGSTTTVGYVNVKGVADGTDTHDAVNLGQLNNVGIKSISTTAKFTKQSGFTIGPYDFFTSSSVTVQFPNMKQGIVAVVFPDSQIFLYPPQATKTAYPSPSANYSLVIGCFSYTMNNGYSYPFTVLYY